MKILEICPLQTSQVKEVVILDRICLGGMWTEEAYLREIESPNSSLLTLHLANNESENTNSTKVGIGCLWSILEEAHIILRGIQPDFQRQGRGTLFLLTLLRDAIARQLEWATLEVNANNKKAINLYKKFGFEIAGKRKGYYHSTGDDALVLWLKKIQRPYFETALNQWQYNLKIDLGKNNYYW
ncbi:MAG: GNAT family N-acetyltransferase [Pleurocapsa sp.]